ncbi:GatB/YqeY domain-containing protein [Bacteroidetes/Chlorobi group bacterium ChocPot_Mid]|nr:MAG: GatB/YqeY domain-containing protein [Bacteroidetes/Chlorobi group bacterium ChocPot_Mid]
MTFEEKINEELKLATKSGDKVRLETIRSIRAAIIEFKKSGIGRDMNTDDELKILGNQAKKRKDAIEMFEKGNRFDLVEKEKAELAIIEEFLPKQLSDNEIMNICKKIVNDSGVTHVKDFGKVMGLAMKELKGKADGSKVQAILKSLLSSE